MSYAQSIDGLDTELQTGRVAQDISDLDISLNSAGADGITLVSPANGEVNVAVTTSFEWDSATNYDGYKLVFADNQALTNPTEYYITGKTFTVPVDLSDSTTYYWKVVGGDEVSNTPLVGQGGFTGMTVWDANNDPAPIYVYDQAAPRTVEAANDLATYIETSSGKTKPTVTSVSDSFSFPSRCIKVGFPETFTEREETLIKCVDGGPIELTGVDEYDPQNPNLPKVSGPGSEFESEYMEKAGTYDAVMTFLQDYIGVVWGWIGDIGEAVPNNTELKVATVDERHSPSAEFRNPLRFSDAGNASTYGIGKQWLKRQRAFYNTLEEFGPGHRFSGFYDIFHPDSGGNKIEIFALQPNGTRGTFPTRNGEVQGRFVKMELGEPELITTWFDTNVTPALDSRPQVEIFSVIDNDSNSTGYTVDTRAKETDYPPQGIITSVSGRTINFDNKSFTVDEHVDKEINIIEILSNGVLASSPSETKTIDSNTANSITVTTDFSADYSSSFFYEIIETDTEFVNINYAGGSVRTPALSNRYIEFGKKCFDTLTNTYPDKKILINAYGPTRPAPINPNVYDGVYISNVANDFNSPNLIDSLSGNTFRQNFDDWLAVYPKNQIWRPNVGQGHGHRMGLWLTQVDQAMTRLKEIIPLGVTGLRPDNFWEHWSTQWPMYYAATQILWDHTKDVDAVMDNAYNTLFGDAAPHIKAYYELTETTIVNNPVHNLSTEDVPKVWTETVIAQLNGHISSALGAVNSGTDEYERVEWVQAGLEWCKSIIQSCKFFNQYNSPGVIIDDENLATLSNAIESDVDATTGWSLRYQSFPWGSVADGTDGNEFAFFLDGNSVITSSAKGIKRDTPLPSGPVVTGTATSGTLNSLTDTSKTFVSNDATDRVLRIVGGTNAGQERFIESFTGDTLTTESNFTNNIDSTSEYEIVDMYVATAIARHVGTGTRWVFSDETSTRADSEIDIPPENTEREEYKISCYGGGTLRFRETDDRDGAIYIYSLTIQRAKPVDKQFIEDQWTQNNTDAVNAITSSRWYSDTEPDSRPIGASVYNSSRIPRPGDSQDTTNPDLE